mmetsp:Transcript_26275/g.56898  ORF Transcript_26275/g.56898 Transcript_26275/m.56898 type:complete len:205 (-) Transcript_26275:32-646(-)
MEALFVESKKQYAEKERFKDLHAQMRLGALMQKRYPLGVLGMENPSNPETIVYSDTHERWRHEADMHERTLTRMRENHKRHNRDYNFLQTVKPGEKLDEQSARMFPTKRKSDRPPPNSGLRLFGGPDGQEATDGKESFVMRPPRPSRAEYLRNMETNGRKLNIITGAVIEQVPPTLEERVVHRKLHYSVNPPPTPPHVREFSGP